LLIDAAFAAPRLHQQIATAGPCNYVTAEGLPITCVARTLHPSLFLLPATAVVEGEQPLTVTELRTLLPQLAATFRIVIIDAPPLDRAEGHLLVAKATETWLLVERHRDSLKALKASCALWQGLEVKMRALLLT
jgi:hypothetical protein